MIKIILKEARNETEARLVSKNLFKQIISNFGNNFVSEENIIVNFIADGRSEIDVSGNFRTESGRLKVIILSKNNTITNKEYSKLYSKLITTLVHELEHLSQKERKQNFFDIDKKIINKALLIFQKSDIKDLTLTEQMIISDFFSINEIESYARQIYKQSKMERKNFIDCLKEKQNWFFEYCLERLEQNTSKKMSQMFFDEILNYAQQNLQSIFKR